jgi:tyrosinase
MKQRTRRPIDSVQGDERRQLVAAFAALFDSDDPASNYSFWASIHTACCEHASALFLPWHRAYIFAFEDALRKAIGSDDIALPYWDWCRTPALPSLVDELDAVIKPPNKRPERYTEEQRAACGAPALPTQAQVDDVLSVDNIIDLGGPLCAPDSKGTLECIHGVPHLWVGPWMATLRYAAFDPVFWFHHANVDRLWALWQRSHPGQDPGCRGLSLNGIPGDWRVRDVVTIGSPRLGYEYVTDLTILWNEHREVDSLRPIEIRVPATGRLELRLNGLHAMPTGPGPTALTVFVGAKRLSCSLFGVVDGCPPADPPIPVNIPGCGRRDHAHDMSLRFDLTPWISDRHGATVTVRIQPEGGPTRGARASLMVTSIAVATLPN